LACSVTMRCLCSSVLCFMAAKLLVCSKYAREVQQPWPSNP
jgi:hypothetical protein